ncbi:hypothetical protein Tco_1157435 [Tanacetum coccineum]
MSALLLCSGRFLALVLQLQIGYGYRQARMPLVESIMDAPCKPINFNDETFTSQPKGNNAASSQPKSNVNGDNGNPVDDLVDETRKKVEVPHKKTPRKTSIWSGRKTDSPKRNVVFFPKTKIHYFHKDDMELDNMGQVAEGWEHENAYNDNG